MNLLDQLELYVMRAGGSQALQKDYWLFVFWVLGDKKISGGLRGALLP